MKREQLSATDSVADLFKVATAKPKRRALLRKNSVDWELLAQILQATYQFHPEPWPTDPIDALVMIALETLRPGGSNPAVVLQLKHLAGGNWANLLHTSATLENFGFTEAELGHLRTVLRFVVLRFGGLTLAPLTELGNDRALKELVKLPGIDLATACKLLLRSFERPLLPPTLSVRLALTRIGVLPAGLTDAASLNELQRIPAGVPINSLHDGLYALVEGTCHWDRPACDSCPLLRLCAHGRMTMKSKKAPGALTFVDLFAGAGGMSLGLTQAGFQAALAVELEDWACETYRANHPELPADRVLAGDIRKLDPSQAHTLMGCFRPDMVVGGPPCQGFSLIGKRGRSAFRFVDDPRNKLYMEFLRWIAYLHPRLVVMENVQGLYSYADGAIRKDIEANLNEIGYVVDDLVVDASRFGVPQRRQRVIFIAVSTADYGEAAPGLAHRITSILRGWNDEAVTLYDAIADLPPLDAGAGTEATRVKHVTEPSGYAKEMGADRNSLLLHHIARPINLRDKLLYSRLKPGEKAGDAVEQGARHLMVYRNDVFDDKYRRLKYDEPSPTIMSHLAKDGHMFIHPDPKQRRSITVREAARIQSFPDDFIFLGPRTAQFTQVGNAVPPKLARAIGEAIIQALAEVKQ